ncbi:diaminopropionate ammonia-lyase [Roseibium polysiphoniae]|uniref:diaminopropionate ammonia-lyase n=1 Tax=Roseibium polysiphoniae TaxID=2571221 RepID=UPI003296C6BC
MLDLFANSNTGYFDAGLTGERLLPDLLTREQFDRAENEVSSWEGYEKTPLLSFGPLAADLGLGEVLYKHEGDRFGLGSFKALGGAYAVMCVLQREISKRIGKDVSLAKVRDRAFPSEAKDITVISATDGNHGRSVAWGAARCGVSCRIYVHAEVSEHRVDAMRALGADVIRIDGDYDATVEQTRLDAEQNGWLIVSDTSWTGYTQTPIEVMAGYGVMAREITRDLATPPTHVFLQGGVGGLAAAVAAVFRQDWGTEAPKVYVVEPELAPCLFESSKAGRSTAVQIAEETIMAGLSCGEPSEVAWSVLASQTSGFLTIPEEVVAPTVRMLASFEPESARVQAGESGVAGLCGLICAATQPNLRAALGLNESSRVVLIGSEGVTDPVIYDQIIKGET